MKLDREHSIEIAFLAIATIYSLTLPLKHSVTLFDSVILITIFVLYTVRVSRAPAEEPHLVGPGALPGDVLHGGQTHDGDHDRGVRGRA